MRNVHIVSTFRKQNQQLLVYPSVPNAQADRKCVPMLNLPASSYADPTAAPSPSVSSRACCAASTRPPANICVAATSSGRCAYAWSAVFVASQAIAVLQSPLVAGPMSPSRCRLASTAATRKPMATSCLSKLWPLSLRTSSAECAGQFAGNTKLPSSSRGAIFSGRISLP